MAGTKVQLYDYNNQPIEPEISLNLENYVTDASLKQNYYDKNDITEKYNEIKIKIDEISNSNSDNNSYVTIDGEQNISGMKTFENGLKTTEINAYQPNDGTYILSLEAGLVDVTGSINCNNGSITASAFYESSDERLKTFKDNIYIDLDKLQSIRKSYFSFNRTLNKNEIGISAQEIQKYYPEIVSEDNNGYLSVDYCKLSVIALAAIDKLYDRIKYLEYKINNLN